MKSLKFINIFYAFIFINCENAKQEIVKVHNVDGITLYQSQCGDNIYFSLKKLDCDSLPKDYFLPIGDGDNYFCLFLRKKKNSLEIYSPYNDLIKKGNIDKLIKIVEYKDYRDNVFIEDSIIGKSYVIQGNVN